MIFGPWGALTEAVQILPHPESFFSTQIVSIVGFAALIAWGLAHRRMMILATVALASAGFARLSEQLLHPAVNTALSYFAWTYYGDVLLIVLMAAWDWWRGRLMRPFVIAAVALLAAECVASFLRYWGPWNEFAVAVARAWAKA